eukprot:gene26421-29852_t
MSFDRTDVKEQTSGLGPTAGKFLGSIATPALITRTLIGNPLYTTPDAINEIKDDFLGQLDIADLVYKDFEDIPLTKLYTQFNNVKFILSGRQAGGRKIESNCDSGGMNIDTHNGRKQLNVEKYLHRIAIDQPKVIVALADEVNVNISKKRLTKAIERSTTWFQSLVTASTSAGVALSGPEAIFLFGVAQYDKSYTVQLPIWIKHMLSQGAKGIVIGNAHLGESKEERAESITAIKALVPAEVPTLIQGADTLAEILQSLSLGVDLISTNYPECLAKAGRALALRLPGDPVVAEDASDNNAADSRKHARTASEGEPSTKRPRIDYSNPHALPAAPSDLSDTGNSAKQSDNAGQSACANKRGPGKSAAKAVAPNEAEFPRAKCEMNLWDV